MPSWNMRRGGRQLPALMLGLASLACLPPPSSAAPENRSLLKRYKPLVMAARRFLDVDVAYHKSHKPFEDALIDLAARDDRLLADPRRLSWLVNQSRRFLPHYGDAGWRSSVGLSKPKPWGRVRSIRDEVMQIAYMLPKTWSGPRKARTYPWPEPHPLLLTLHDPEHGRKREPPGVEAIKKRYPYAAFREVYESWMVLAPEAGRGLFVQEDGTLREDALGRPLHNWKLRYPVDLQRVVLDGGAAALDVAPMLAAELAGLVLRAGALDTDRRRAGVKNFAPVPVFVVANAKLAKALRTAGHPDVTGGGEAALCAWLRERRRVEPKRFEWEVVSITSAAAHWVKIEDVDPNAARPTLKAEVLDTKEDPNTVRIECHGVRMISLFLDDTLLDLDEPVRVVINRSAVHEKSFKDPRFGRSLAILFGKGGLRMRKGMRYGRISPAVLFDLDVPAAK